MANAYESYIRMLLWESSEQDDGTKAAGELPPVVTLVVVSDNARSLSGETSMTMNLLKPTVASTMDRWSSLPELTEMKAGFTKKSRRRSVDDLRELMTSNSRIPHSSSSLSPKGRCGNAQSIGRLPANGASTNGKQLKRCCASSNATSPNSVHRAQQNDQWESGSKGNKKSEKSPFDLRMPLRTSSNESLGSDLRVRSLPLAA